MDRIHFVGIKYLWKSFLVCSTKYVLRCCLQNVLGCFSALHILVKLCKLERSLIFPAENMVMCNLWLFWAVLCEAGLTGWRSWLQCGQNCTFQVRVTNNFWSLENSNEILALTGRHIFQVSITVGTNSPS